MSVINYSLENMQAAYNKFGPYDFKTIHIAGTNGKGSVCTFLELLYLTCLPEIKVGKYTSPHIWNITERFSVNGEDIDLDTLDVRRSTLNEFLSCIQRPTSNPLTEFEKLTLIAFEYFKEKQVDIAILETGLGGRLDATNAIPIENRLATAITNVAMDHMDYLGNSIEEIRREKEGIRRNGVPHFEPEELDVRRSTLKEASNLQRLTSNPNSESGSNFQLALTIFESINNLEVSDKQKQEILRRFPQRHRARFEYHDGVLLDAAHNPAGMKQLNHFIRTELPNFKRRIFVLAFLDKDYKSCLEELFAEGVLNQDRDLVILTEVDSSRATPAFMIDELIDANKMIILDPKEAVLTAIDLKGLKDLVVITGSIRLIAACKADASHS